MISEPESAQNRVLLSDDGRTRIALPKLGELRVGRSDGCDVVLTEPSVSRRHAVLFLGPSELAVADAGSRAGTFLNDVQITRRTPVRPGDLLGFGDARLRLSVEPASPIGGDGWGDSTAMFDQAPMAASTAERPPSEAQPGRPEPLVESDSTTNSRQSSSPTRADGRVTVRGTVRSPTVRSESFGQGAALQILNFSLLVHDSRGGIADAIAVDMRGLGLKGPPPVDGQDVQVTGTFTSDGVLDGQEIRLLDTNAVVKPTGRGAIKATKIFGAIVITIVVLAFVGVALGALGFLNPSGNPTVEKVTVPAVRQGEKLAVVEDRLRDAGFTTEWIREDDPNVDFSSVIRIDPPSGSQAAKGSTIKIYLSIHTG